MSDLRNEEKKNQQADAESTPDLPVQAEEEFSLEDILAEFGKGASAPAPTQEETAPVEESGGETEEEFVRVDPPSHARPAGAQPAKDWREITKPLPDLKERGDGQEMPQKVLRFPGSAEKMPEENSQPEETAAVPTTEPAAQEPAPPVDDPPLRRLEEVMSQTVDAVLEKEDDGLLEEPVTWQDRLDRVKKTARDGWQKLERAYHRSDPDIWAEPMPEEDEEPAEPEPDLESVSREERRSCKRLRRQLLFSTLPVVALVVLSVMHTWFHQYLPELWMDNNRLRCLVMGGLLLLTVVLVPALWKCAAADLREKHFTCAAAALLPAVVVLADCVYGAFTAREVYLPLAGPAAVFIWLCLLGRLQTALLRRQMYRLADLGGVPPYALSMTAAGICKQRGRLEGFYRTSRLPDPAQQWQYRLLPLLLAACTVLSGVVCFSGKRMDEFFWVWSAMLTASLPLSLPLSASLPMHCLGHRLGRSGCAVAGFAGARSVSAAKRLVLTDSDLFPPGTVSLNGLKIYGEEIGKVVSYAATMARAAESPLQPIFDQLLSSEGGTCQELRDLRFYEEGGVEGIIKGESVVMGSAYCMKKMRVTLPRELKLKTGVFLAVDGQLIAIFAIKYQPSRNVEWALRALRRNHIEVVMGTRSANITPGLLHQKFGIDVKPIYPTISTRLGLSDLTGSRAPRADALLYREGLMPFAETVIGSRRCCRMVRLATVLAWLSSLAGLVLSYYLTSSAAYAALSCGYVLAFLLLLLVPVWLLAGMVKYY